MRWEEIRSHYPRRWLLAEALEAHSEFGNCVLEQLAVLGTFPDSALAMQSYARFHREAPERELYVFHTNHETLDLPERRWLGFDRDRIIDDTPARWATLHSNFAPAREASYSHVGHRVGHRFRGTVFAADKVFIIDLLYEPRDGVRRIRGIGVRSSFSPSGWTTSPSGSCGRMTSRSKSAR